MALFVHIVKINEDLDFETHFTINHPEMKYPIQTIGVVLSKSLIRYRSNKARYGTLANTAFRDWLARGTGMTPKP